MNLFLLMVTAGSLVSCEARKLDGEQTNDKDRGSSRNPSKNPQGRLFKFALLPFFQGQKGQQCTGHGKKCIPANECTKYGGYASGHCSNAYYVCCTFQARCGSTIKEPQAILVNDDFPTPVTTLGNCQYIIEKVHKNICQLRVELETLKLAGPGNDSVCADDRFTLNSGTGEKPVVLCGENSQQHLYVDLAEGASSARINIATSSIDFERTWRIKVKQISCESKYKAPPNCLQYFTDFTGNIKSFNYQDSDAVHQLGGLKYTICVKSRPGFCGITYKATDFSMSDDATSAGVRQAVNSDQGCQNDFISIFTVDSLNVAQPDRYCGNLFTDVTTFAKPFQIRVVTNNDENEAGEQSNHGFNMNYMQIPC